MRHCQSLQRYKLPNQRFPKSNHQKTIFTSFSQNCENILTKLIYEIHHDGNDGIKEVQVLIEMTNFSPRLTYPEDHVVFTQTFGYNHYWSSDNVTSTLKEKSGNPGYLGKMLQYNVKLV